MECVSTYILFFPTYFLYLLSFLFFFLFSFPSPLSFSLPASVPLSLSDSLVTLLMMGFHYLKSANATARICLSNHSSADFAFQLRKLGPGKVRQWSTFLS